MEVPDFTASALKKHSNSVIGGGEPVAKQDDMAVNEMEVLLAGVGFPYSSSFHP